jgi:hypothetical protein
MDRQSDGKSGRNRWKDENRHPKLYDERSDTPGQQQQQQNGKTPTASSSASSSKTLSSSSSGSSKLIKGDIVNQLAQNPNLPEDVRISKLLRRLETETTVTGTIEICGKLKVVVQDQANANYIKRSFDMLTNSLVAVMKECHSGEAVNHVAEVYGMIGFVLRNDFPLYKTWILKTYKSIKTLRAAMMHALQKTLKMDYGEQRLENQIGRLMELLRDFLEQTEDSKVFIAITNLLITIARNYNVRYFKPHFTNIVDIVIGWMMENQQTSVKVHCAVVLQSLGPFFRSDTQFSLDLIGQLLEDIDGCITKMEDIEDDSAGRNFKDFGAFVGEL